MMTIRALTLSLVSSALILPAGGLSAQEQTEQVGESLVVYSGTGLPADLADALVEPFAQYMDDKYGVPVQVQTVPGQIPTTWVTLQTEWPNPSGDVYLLYNQNIRQGIDQDYWLPLETEYSEQEWARFDADAMETLDTQGYSAPMEIAAWVLAVQDSLEEGAVTSMADLAKEEFSGRITFDSALSVGSGYNAIAAAAEILEADWRTWFEDGSFDEEAARPSFELVGEWAENALTLTQGSGSIRPLLRRGEALVSAWWWHNVQFEMAEGTPIHVVEPEEGVIAIVQSGPVVSASTDNPVAAIEWVKFFHSETATEVATEIDYINRMPREGEQAAQALTEFTQSADFVFIDELRDTMLSQDYNQQVLDFYNRVVIQGQ